MSQLAIKPGVRVTGIKPEILVAWIIAGHVFAAFNVPAVITSAVDGAHMTGSLHYAGLAIDLRTHELPDAPTKAKVVAELKSCLGPDYDVVLENEDKDTEHIHVEFQPKQPIYLAN